MCVYVCVCMWVCIIITYTCTCGITYGEHNQPYGSVVSCQLCSSGPIMQHATVQNAIGVITRVYHLVPHAGGGVTGVRR